jgi:hypothetical protein
MLENQRFRTGRHEMKNGMLPYVFCLTFSMNSYTFVVSDAFACFCLCYSAMELASASELLTLLPLFVLLEMPLCEF